MIPQINIEEADKFNDHSEETNLLVWQSVENWFLKNDDTIKKIENAAISDESLLIDIHVSQKLWQEIQAYQYLFGKSIVNLIKFKSKTRYIVYMLIPILRDELNFNSNPRYVKNDEALQHICNIARNLFDFDKPKPIQHVDVQKTLLKISKLNFLDESIKLPNEIIDSSSVNHGMTPFHRVKEAIKSSVNSVALALNDHLDQAEEEYIKISTSFNISPKEDVIEFMEPELLTQYIEKAMDNNNSNNSYNWDGVSKSIAQDLEVPKDGVVNPPETAVIMFFQYYAAQRFFNYLYRHQLKMNNSASLMNN